MNCVYHYESPLGGITMACEGDSLTGLWFDGQKYFGSTLGRNYEKKRTAVFDEACRWLDLYFQGKEPDFRPGLLFHGTPFQKTVWEILLTIPYGQTVTYGEIARKAARKLGLPSMSAQAAGGAVGRNPISLIVPCHRVIAKSGSLTGYAGGIEKKKWLLRLEETSKAAKCNNHFHAWETTL